MVAQIKQLSAHIAERLRSDLVVTSLTQGIEELVSNSIDAGATEIKVDIKPSQFSFLVEDDGCGITSASFGRLATRYATSKLENMSDFVKGLDTLGFRGEALSSLAQSANLEITSKAKGAFETHTKILQGGNVLRDGLALEQRTKHGTRVVVRDLFFNRPVRRKHLAGSRLKKELDDCREHMLRLALPRPSVGFTLVDSTRKSTILCLKRGRIEKDVLPLVFGQRLVQQGMQREGPVEAELYISRPLEGLSAKSRQYMYVNSRYVCNDAASKLLNTLFQQVLQDLNRRGCEQQGAARRFPAFVCHISCPPGMLDVTARPDKTAVQFTSWAPVLAAVRAAAMHAWHQYVPLTLLTGWHAHSSAPALSQPQPALMSAAVAPQDLTVEGASVWEGAHTASCGGGSEATGGAGDGQGARAQNRVRFSLDEGTRSDRTEADPAIEQHAAAHRQPRMLGGPEGAIPWLSAPDSACGGSLPCADKPSAQLDMSHWHERGMTSCGLSFRPRKDRDSGGFNGRDGIAQRRAERAHLAEYGAPGTHEAGTADALQDLGDWDSESCDGRDQIAQHALEEAELAECRLRSMQAADMTDAWGDTGSPDRDLGVLDCLGSPASAAFAAQLPQSPTLVIPLGARTHTAAGAAALHRHPQLSFRVRRRPSEPSQLHPNLDLRAEAPGEDYWCMQPDQAHLNSSSSDAETLQSAPGSVAPPGRHDMAADLGDWMQTDTEVIDELAAPLCCPEEGKQPSAQERDELGSGPLAALHHAEQQQQHHRGESSLHEDCGTQQISGARSSRCRQPGGRRRASSAPPHHRPCMRAAHTNPVFSLCSSGGRRDAEHALQDQFAPSKAAWQAYEGALSAHETAQTSGHELARKRRRRRMQTFSGVCSGHRFASTADPIQLCNEGPCAAQQREVLGNAVPERSSAFEASHALEPRMRVSGPAKERLAEQSVLTEEEDREAVRVKGGAPLQAPARRRRPQRAAHANAVGHNSRENLLASIVEAESAEPPVKGCQGEAPALQPGTNQVDGQAQIGSAQLLQTLQNDAGGNAAGLDEKAAVGGAGGAVAGSGDSVAELLREWVNPACASGQRQVPDLASLACGNLLGLVPAAITKESLDAARSLRQVDRKFVPLVCGSQLAIMDQHAADERVVLERLTAQVIGPGGLPVSAQSCVLSPSQPLDVSPAEPHLLDSFRAPVEAWGWRWELVPADDARFGAAAAAGSADGARLTHAAVVLGTPLNGVELQTFLHQLQSSSGSAKVPPGVLRVLASKACHSAIRFGDELNAGQCEELLSNLKRTRSWHCCAHGRPTVAPLVDMRALHRVLGLRGCVT